MFFQMALAIFHVHEESILQCTDGMEVFAILKQKQVLADDLLLQVRYTVT